MSLSNNLFIIILFSIVLSSAIGCQKEECIAPPPTPTTPVYVNGVDYSFALYQDSVPDIIIIAWEFGVFSEFVIKEYYADSSEWLSNSQFMEAGVTVYSTTLTPSLNLFSVPRDKMTPTLDPSIKKAFVGASLHYLDKDSVQHELIKLDVKF